MPFAARVYRWFSSKKWTTTATKNSHDLFFLSAQPSSYTFQHLASESKAGLFWVWPNVPPYVQRGEEYSLHRLFGAKFCGWRSNPPWRWSWWMDVHRYWRHCEDCRSATWQRLFRKHQNVCVVISWRSLKVSCPIGIHSQSFNSKSLWIFLKYQKRKGSSSNCHHFSGVEPVKLPHGLRFFLPRFGNSEIKKPGALLGSSGVLPGENAGKTRGWLEDTNR